MRLMLAAGEFSQAKFCDALGKTNRETKRERQ
jgi:hypothetical protein